MHFFSITFVVRRPQELGQRCSNHSGHHCNQGGWCTWPGQSLNRNSVGRLRIQSTKAPKAQTEKEKKMWNFVKTKTMQNTHCKTIKIVFHCDCWEPTARLSRQGVCCKRARRKAKGASTVKRCQRLSTGCAHEICVPAAGMPPAEHENAKTRKPENGENGGNAKHENGKKRKRRKRENGKNAKTRKAGKPFLQKAKKHYNQLSHYLIKDARRWEKHKKMETRKLENSKKCSRFPVV